MKRMISAATVLAAIGVTAIAGAQMSPAPDTSPNNLTIRAGVALPIDQSLSNVSNSFMNVGIEYTFNNSLLKGGETYLSIDAFFKDWSGVTAYPVAINQRFYTGTNAMGHRSYFFLGIGMTWTDVGDSTFDAISARGGFGTELGDHIIAELTGYIGDSAGGTRPNAVSINIGYRF